MYIGAAAATTTVATAAQQPAASASPASPTNHHWLVMQQKHHRRPHITVILRPRRISCLPIRCNTRSFVIRETVKIDYYYVFKKMLYAMLQIK